MTARTVAPAEPADPTVVSVERDGSGRHLARELRPGAFLAPRPLLPSPDRLRIALVGIRAGLLTGDDLRLHISVGPGARLELVEPSGLVAYDHRGGSSTWRARVDIAEGGELRWNARPFVISTGACVERSMDIALAAGARMLWRDTLVLGRSGERGGSVRATTRATYDGHELLVEDLDLTDPELRELPGILGPNRIIGSVTALGTRPGGPPHPYRMELAGPGAQVRLLDTVTPALDAELATVWENWLVTG
ncbi:MULTISPECIES: urease accessory protein UreD [unclassified Streptomyces]|uniref:urease accessory protein UreD n=1 Tax=unclassified Streptomyces TaxID=2593676 RepID=UPI00225BD69F|nr:MULTISPECIES: urease accessory protein UreD [unclassified Streptomyces]MCX4790192.1 urease accessory protein UreD [Streptomyces sp. NBC_01221]WSJ35482.1 urease accessory protein UreD [Streptomyces sp. NBC_01321]WSP61913.1 urease accessory protein UreD [Streptomyces sp. NBC_01240]WSU20991.1 urease accessory protein UreD [Streptomyces sp. NBC_01108]